MRDLHEVIECMIKVSTNETLNQKLKRIQSDIGFTAPEAMGVRWNKASMVLNSHIPNIFENDETIEIASIFMGMTLEELKKIDEGDDK